MRRVKDQDEEGKGPGDQEDPGTRGPRDQGTKGPEDQGNLKLFFPLPSGYVKIAIANYN